MHPSEELNVVDLQKRLETILRLMFDGVYQNVYVRIHSGGGIHDLTQCLDAFLDNYRHELNVTPSLGFPNLDVVCMCMGNDIFDSVAHEAACSEKRRNKIKTMPPLSKFPREVLDANFKAVLDRFRVTRDRCENFVFFGFGTSQNFGPNQSRIANLINV